MSIKISNQDKGHHHCTFHEQDYHTLHAPLLIGQQTHLKKAQPNTQQQRQMFSLPAAARCFFGGDNPTSEVQHNLIASNAISCSQLPQGNANFYMGIHTPSDLLFPNGEPDLYLHAWEVQPCLQLPASPIPNKSRQSHARCLNSCIDAFQSVDTDECSKSGHVEIVSAPGLQMGSFEPFPVNAYKIAIQEDQKSSTLDRGSYLASIHTSTERERRLLRVPHTVVERRYRENLNAQIDRLRQSVPALASRCAQDGTAISNEYQKSTISQKLDEPETTPPVNSLPNTKPSKSEILRGAIEHIHAVELDNVAAREEIEHLRSQLAVLQRWYDFALCDLSGQSRARLTN
jgi:hypothetical protein